MYHAGDNPEEELVDEVINWGKLEGEGKAIWILPTQEEVVPYPDKWQPIKYVSK